MRWANNKLVNHKYSKPVNPDSRNVDIFKTLFKDMCGMTAKSKQGATVVVKVRLPARISHRFWREERPEDLRGSDDGADEAADDAEDGDEYTMLEWTGWGIDSEVAKVSAAKAVENIIRDLRVRVQQWQQQCYPLDNNSTVANTETALEPCWETRVNTSASECRILRTGQKLCRAWRLGRENFLVPGPRFGIHGIGIVHDASLPSILTRYYEVSPTFPFVPLHYLPLFFYHKGGTQVPFPVNLLIYLTNLHCTVILPNRNAAILQRRRTPNKPPLRNRLQN